MNVYDSDKMKDIFLSHDIQPTDDYTNADFVVLNTCHIREKATEKTFSDLGRFNKKGKKGQTVIVAGCVAQAEGELIQKRAPYVDLVIGPQSIQSLDHFLKKDDFKEKAITEFDAIEKFDTLNQIKTNHSSKTAFVTIQEGCDKFCHFCVVPYTRGPECSRPFDSIIKEAEQLIENGAKEITLLGQNVNAYSYFRNKKELRISNLLNQLEKYTELKRIRYTTSHPLDMTEDLIDCYSSNKKLMPFIHLPIQSGSNKILKLMNRKHKVEDYLDIFSRLMQINPLIKLSSDFIIGYPGEEKIDFEDTLNLVKNIKFINSYSFIFSSRPGTTASKLNQIDKSISKERLIELQSVLFKNQIEHNESLHNKKIDVLVENKINNQNKYFGRNVYLNSVIIDANKNDIGKVVKVNIENSNQNTLFGKTTNKMKAA